MGAGITDRAMQLLGSGVPANAVASALGVTEGFISQLLSQEEFSNEVTNLKFAALSKHTARDASYDEIEDQLIAKLGKSVPLLIRPGDILGAIKIVNGAKRRGHDSTDSIVNQQNIVQITMPTQIIQEFTKNIDNQVITAGDQDLRTMQSGDLLKTVAPEQEIPTLSAPILDLTPEPVFSRVLDNSDLISPEDKEILDSL